MIVDFFFRFSHPWLAIILSVCVGSIAYLRFYWYKPIKLRYSLVAALKNSGRYQAGVLSTLVPWVLRLGTLLFLALLIARPQLVDVQSKIRAEGIDIMLVLDASGSMQCFDDIHDQRPRFDVAKKEAIRFIEKRENDPIGLVIFGKDAISRCPLTLDKTMLKTILNDLKVGDIDPDGTVLSMAISMAAKRLKDSKAKSKIMIVLTDGEPTAQLDIEPRIAVTMAKKLGIKIYTIGVGDEHGGLWKDPLFGVRSMGFSLNIKLLQAIAKETGGQFFLAKKPHDVQRIYDIINTLEKTEYEMPIFTHYTDMVVPWLLIIMAFFCAELIATSFIWFRV